MLHNVPYELRLLPQWIVWRYEETMAGKPTKVPYDPKSGRHAAVNDPATWADFDTVMQAANKWDGIGFIFTKSDPFTGIDLDENSDPTICQIQSDIYTRFASYSELSPSGRGLHIICKGSVPHGRRFASIEVYSSERFFTITGNVFQMARPIEPRQDLLDELYRQIEERSGRAKLNGSAYNGDLYQREDDNTIIERARNAVNGDRFSALYAGEWHTVIDQRTSQPYTSQSEADFALINIIAFYTQNRIQIERIFLQSALGQRPKAKRNDYMQHMINRAFDLIPPPIDFDKISNALNEAIARQLSHKPEPVNVAANPITDNNPYAIPPGLVGEIAQFIYQSAPRPVPEIALIAAIGFMSGLCGRAFNVSGAGLNQYLIMVTPTGNGKEAMAAGIDRLISQLRLNVPSITTFRGPSEIASGPGLIKAFYKSPSFVSVLGEFGYRLQALASDRANPNDINIKRVLLDLYSKSGHGQVVYPFAYSDKDKNGQAVMSPAFTLICESTPQTFFGAVDERLINDGLLPRFIVIEYNGARPPLNYNHSHVMLNDEMRAKLVRLCTAVLALQQNNIVQQVDYASDTRAAQLLAQFNVYCDQRINATKQEAVRQLWTRAYLKVLKLAAVVAVGVNCDRPVIEVPHVEWARGIIEHEITALLKRFEEGTVGTQSIIGLEESHQIKDVAKIIWGYLNSDYAQLRPYRVDKGLFDAKLIGFSYLLQKVSRLSSFKRARFADHSKNLDKVLTYLSNTEIISFVNTRQPEFIAKFGGKEIRAKLVCVPDYERLVELIGEN